VEPIDPHVVRLVKCWPEVATRAALCDALIVVTRGSGELQRNTSARYSRTPMSIERLETAAAVLGRLEPNCLNPLNTPIGAAAPRLRRLEDVVGTASAPEHGTLTVDLGPLPSRPAIRVGFAPRHLPHLAGALHLLHSHSARPRVGFTGGRSLSRLDERGQDLLAELLVVVGRERRDVAVERSGALELQLPFLSASRSSKSSSLESLRLTRLSTMSSEASASIVCHSFVQNHF
jgi:hypothetical protein